MLKVKYAKITEAKIKQNNLFMELTLKTPLMGDTYLFTLIRNEYKQMSSCNLSKPYKVCAIEACDIVRGMVKAWQSDPSESQFIPSCLERVRE